MTRSMNLKLNADWQGVVLGIANVATELCWLWPLMLLVNGVWADGRLNLPGLSAVYLLSFIFNQITQRRGWRTIILTSINWILWAIVMLVSVKVQLFGQTAWMDSEWLMSIPMSVPRLIYSVEPQLLLVALSLVLWWLGKWLAYREANFKTSMAEFQFGLLLLLIVYLISTAVQYKIPQAAAVTILFFLFSLGGIALAHLMEGRKGLHQIGGTQMYSLMLGSIAVVLIMGLVITVIITPDLLRLMLAALAWLGSAFMNLLAWLASLIPDSGPAEAIPPMPTMPAGESEPEQFWRIPENVRAWLQIGWGIVWIMFFALALWRISTQIYSWLSRRAHTAKVVNQPMKGAFKEDIVALFKRLWRNIASYLSVWRFRGRGASAQETSVHQIYHSFLKWGAKRGYPRGITQTPDEYMAGLAAVLPMAREDISGVTKYYVRIRYSSALATRGELFNMRQQWNRIKQYRFKKNNSCVKIPVGIQWKKE